MSAKNVGGQIPKQILGMLSSHFCVKSRLTLSPIHILVALLTIQGKLLAIEKIETFICQSNKIKVKFGF